MATTYPDLYAAVGIHSGLPYAAADDMSSALAAMRDGAARPGPGGLDDVALLTLPMIVFHGDDDRTVHPSNGAHVIAQGAPQTPRTAGEDDAALIQKGASRGRAYTRTLYRNARGKSMKEHWLVHGAGHAWSGGRAAGSYTDPKGPEASREMVRFFMQHA